MSDFKKLSDEVSVYGQISENQMPLIAKAEFKSIICNRPDQEMPMQPTFSVLEEAAKTHGIESVFIPMSMGALDLEVVTMMQTELKKLPKPILVFCGSGMRSTLLWCFANASELGVDEILSRAQHAGYNLEQFRTSLEHYSAQE
ncbi:MAG: TIGR01244 family phosphatase [Robiginitomaculum sp.]|nr:MAG: TIGR01244 family phosphatase [Robiginitomaculum sp.]